MLLCTFADSGCLVYYLIERDEKKIHKDMLKNKSKQQMSNKEVVASEEEVASEENRTQGAGTSCANVSDDAEEEVAKSAEVADDADKTTDEVEGNKGLKSEVEKLSAECAEWRDKYLRLSAEFDNYRKRTLKEKMDLIASGGEDVIKALLPVMDDIDRALAAMTDAKDVEAVRKGVELISQKLLDMLHGKGLSEIEALGQELDTDLHEAVAKFAAGEEKKGKIIDVVQKGYKLKDKVVRYAKVVVGE